MVEAIKENTGLIVKACSEWNELGDALRENPKQMTVHIDMIGLHGVTVHEFMSMLETLIRMSSIRTIPIAIIIDHTTPMSVIKELQKTNVMGIIPSTPSFGIPEGIKGLEALINRIPYWPKHILDQLPGAKKKVLKNTIKLTQRQAQIVNLISERGLTNKKIAQALNITESTVKIHVSAILKAYGVRTRTQLALAAIK
jgi:DNA-binding NarL/FixJ family response regulator